VNLLLDRARNGEDGAVGELIAELQPRVFRWALGLTADADEADDVVQETFVALYRSLDAFRGDAAFDAWLYRITARAASQRRRTLRRRERILAGTRPEREVYLTDPGARVDRQRLAAAVHELWRLLPERQRTVFDLVDLQGYTPAQVSELLGMKAVTVRANLFKGRRTIRAALLRYDEGSFPGRTA
jgi:RNA polymerase sigma factor (sigma-70 family)